MRTHLKSAALAAMFAGTLATSAHAGFVEQVFRFTFDDLGSTSYLFDANHEEYKSSSNPNVGIKLTSGPANKPSTLDLGSLGAPLQPDDHSNLWPAPPYVPPYPAPPSGTTNGSVALNFVDDLTITPFATDPSTGKTLSAAIATIEFASLTSIGDFSAEGNGGGLLACNVNPLWCDLGPIDLSAQQHVIVLGGFKGVNSVKLGQTAAGTIDDIIVTLVYEVADGSVPEPGSMALAAAALGGAAMFRRRKPRA